MIKHKIKIVAAILIYVLVSCATNPLTGRSSLSLVPNSQLFPQSFSQYKEVLQSSQVDRTSKDAKMISQVGERIKYAAEKFYTEQGLANALKGYEWQFELVKDNQINAWCMPGGKVVFYTGIMPICKNEAGVAVVMGHEVAHALAGHSAEKVSHAIVVQYGGQLIGGAISSDQWQSVFSQLYPVGSQIGMLKYGRNMELDADKAGLFLMAMAGYDPREAIAFWERMEAATSGKSTPEFLSTHPNEDNRIEQIRANLPKALEYYNASPYKGK